ncbi:hypothetical protein MTO96_037590, partial [Rhipicephalus appendiculatus]
ADSQDTGREPREAVLAIIICLCLLTLIGVVVVLVFTASDIVRLIMCTVSETAISEDMYPPDNYCDYLFYTNVITSNGRIQAAKDPVSWDLFQRMGPKYTIMQLGIAFEFPNVTPNDLDDASNDLDALRREGIRHYGLLSVVSFANSLLETVRNTSAMFEIQAKDPTAKTAVAIGTYDFNFALTANIRQGFYFAANTLKADIVVFIASTGRIGPQGACIAAPPNTFQSPGRRYFDLGHAWFTVTRGSTYRNPSIITGLSFEMSPLQYVMKDTIKSLKESLFKPCVSVKRERQAFCEKTNTSGRTWDHVDYPMFQFGLISNASKVLTVGELNNTLAQKCVYAALTYGSLRPRTAWLLFNVHNIGTGNQCGDRPFDVIKLFCIFLKGNSDLKCPD